MSTTRLAGSYITDPTEIAVLMEILLMENCEALEALELVRVSKHTVP